MKCPQVKDLLSAYQDGELEKSTADQVRSHMDACPACLKEYKQLSYAWAMLDQALAIEPSPGYMSRFWTKVATQETAQERLSSWLKSLLGSRRFVPALVSLCLMIMIGSTGVIQQINTQRDLSQIKSSDVEMLQNMDLAEHFDTIRDLDVIQNLKTVPGSETAQT